MAQRFVTNLDLNQNQLLNGRFEVLASDPNTGNFEGRLIYNSTEKTIKYFDGTSWKKALVSIDSAGSASAALSVSESNGVITLTPNLATTSSHGVMSLQDKTKLDDATAEATAGKLVIRDGSGQAKFGTPTDPAHAATKGYVDSARSGLDVKQSVRAATTGPLTIATDLEAGDVLDTTVTLVAGDRVLVKDQSTSSENGIYIVQASGPAVRATDFDSTDEVTPGAFTFVEEGTENGDSGWVVITDGTITVGSTGIEFAQFSGTGQIVAGAALEKDGSTLNVLVDGLSIEVANDELRIASGAAGDGLSASVGVLSVNVASDGGLEIQSDDLQIKVDTGVNGLVTTTDGLAIDSSIAGTGLTFSTGTLSVDAISLNSASGGGVVGVLPIANGGTNSSTEEQARTNLAATTPGNTTTPVLARVASKVIGDGVNTSYTITHNFNTRSVIVQVFDSSSYDTVIADVVRNTVNEVVVSFSAAPASNAFTVVVSG